MRIAILGTTGMLGSELYSVFSKTDFEIIPTTRAELDAQYASIDDIAKIVKNCDYVINCIGIIKPYIHDDNSLEVQRAIEVNGLFPHKLASAIKNTDTKVIQIATDCVFDGAKGRYSETDKHNATDVYGKTKSLGEVSEHNFINLRCSIIGREKKNKISLLEWFLNQPKGAELNGFLNHYWNGVTTLAFAKICLGIIKNDFKPCGLQHILAADIVSKAQMLHDFAEIFDRQDIKIKNIEASEPIDRSLSTNNPENNKILWQNAEYREIPTVREMVQELTGLQ